MLYNNQMDIEAFPSPPVPLDIDTAIISEQSQLEEASNDQEMPSLISFSTPVKANKRRKITDQQKVDTEDECMDKVSKKNSNNYASPSLVSGPNFKNLMKRLLQSSESEISKYYQIKSNNKLILLQGQMGEAPYRYHPNTIKELNEYFQEMKSIQLEGHDLSAHIKSKYSGLIAKLSHDSQVPQAELLILLRSILCPIAGNIPEFPIDSSLLDGIVEKVSYGHPEAGNNFSSWSCTFWQVKKLEILGDEIGKHFLTNYVLRTAARMILENSLSMMISEESNSSKQDLPPSALAHESTVINVDELPINLMKIESGVSTPKKREKEKEKKEKVSVVGSIAALVSNNPASNSSQTSMPKISSFFAKLKKPDLIEKTSGEYFQPFFIKPDVSMAPINQLKEIKTSKSIVLDDFPSDYWAHFRTQSVKIPFKRQTCLCVGYDGKPIRAVLKLLKYEENYRPAYFGTWRKSAPPNIVSSRCPFGRIPEIDYEYDSDAEWDEGDDPEGESLSDLDDEEDDEDEEEELEDNSNQSCTGSVDSWLVPHGYLSDDEGVDDVHLGELEEAAREAELIPPPNQQKKNKRKFVPKEPILLGPFLSDQSVPQILQSNTVQFISFTNDISTWIGNNPFSNYGSVFSGLESSISGSKKNSQNSSSSQNLNEIEKSIFPESLLPSMIQIINANPSAGITKLYDEFILQHGKAVRRRLFESKLNQITIGKVKCPKTGKLRWMFKDEISGVSNLKPENNTIENYFLSNPESSFVMQID